MLTHAETPALPLVAPPLRGRLCESCRLHRARLVVSWPDAQFEVCLDCVPASLLGDAPTSTDSRPAHAPARTARRPDRHLTLAAWWRRALTRPAARVPAARHLSPARPAHHG